MIINQDGTVTITNTQTGEQKTVNPVELGSYSPLLANQYYAYMAAQKALDKASGSGSGSSDVLQAPNQVDTSVVSGGGATTDTSQATPDLSSFQSPVAPDTKLLNGKSVDLSALSGTKINPNTPINFSKYGLKKNSIDLTQPKPKQQVVQPLSTNSYAAPLLDPNKLSLQ